MIDDHRGGAPLGLAALAGIVDDEGIEMRQRPSAASGQQDAESASALPGSHSRLPCLPIWTIAWAAKLAAQPGIEGEIAMGRHEIGIVIAARRIDVVAARRLHGDDDIAEAMDRQTKLPVDEERVLLRLAPALLDLLASRGRQRFEEHAVFGQRQSLRRRRATGGYSSAPPAAVPSAPGRLPARRRPR